MSLLRELKRFDIVLEELFPELPAPRPGLDEPGIDEFRLAVAPLDLSADLETLYRWHDGLEHRVLGGKRMLSAAEVSGSRDFNISSLEHPPAWLPFTDGPDFHFVSLGVPGCSADPSVWAGHTHDVWLNLTHESLEAMIATFNDMATDASESFDRRRELLLGALRYGGEYRLGRSPHAFRYPDPPAGTSIVKYETGTPEPWLRSMGTSTKSLLPRGATTTIADLLDASTHGTVSGTVQGRCRDGRSTSAVRLPHSRSPSMTAPGRSGLSPTTR
ncbi:SMI1/KNR4 family protein [Homoserinimonas sp. A447]